MVFEPFRSILGLVMFVMWLCVDTLIKIIDLSKGKRIKLFK